MYLSKNIWWGEFDRLSKYFGQYEENVLNEIVENSKKYKNFIDLGAGDGYYAVGVLKGKLFEKATCFEISEKGKKVIAENAHLNKVEKNLTIKGEANFKEIKSIISKEGPSLILCDIEGNEFSLFNKKLLKVLKDSLIIIELHDDCSEHLGRDFSNLSDKLIENSKDLFKVRFIERKSPKVNDFNELEDWTDDARLLGFSEERPKRMRWLILSPN